MGGFSFRPLPGRAGNVLHWRGCAFHQRPPPPRPAPLPLPPLTRSNMWPKLGTCGLKSALLLETWSRSACRKGGLLLAHIKVQILYLFLSFNEKLGKFSPSLAEQSLV